WRGFRADASTTVASRAPILGPWHNRKKAGLSMNLPKGRALTPALSHPMGEGELQGRAYDIRSVRAAVRQSRLGEFLWRRISARRLQTSGENFVPPAWRG